MQSKEESKSSRILIIVLFIVFVVLAICVAAYYYTFHGYKKQRPAVAPSSTVLIADPISWKI
jgi:flagellar basal body-associated protein FliL